MNFDADEFASLVTHTKEFHISHNRQLGAEGDNSNWAVCMYPIPPFVVEIFTRAKSTLAIYLLWNERCLPYCTVECIT